jgi:hypothetical protein
LVARDRNRDCYRKGFSRNSSEEELYMEALSIVAALGILPPIVEIRGFFLGGYPHIQGSGRIFGVTVFVVNSQRHCHLRSVSARNVWTVHAIRSTVLILVLVCCFHFVSALWRWLWVLLLNTDVIKILRVWFRLQLPRKATAVERVVARWGGASCVPVGGGSSRGPSGIPCRQGVRVVFIFLSAMAGRFGDGVSRTRTWELGPASRYDLLVSLWI